MSGRGQPDLREFSIVLISPCGESFVVYKFGYAVRKNAPYGLCIQNREFNETTP